MESYTMHQFLPISEHSLVQDAVSFIKELRMSYQLDSPASHSPLQENDVEKMTPEICGLKQSNVFAEYDHDTHCWRMFQISVLTGTLEPFSETWPKHGMMRDGACWELTMWVHPIDERDCGYWPTPRNRMTGAVTPNRSTDKFNNLESILARQIWPTPAARDYRNQHAENSEAFIKRQENPRGVNLVEECQRRNEIGQLNPDWVEWLMGWPICWTSLELIDEILWLDWSVDPADGESNFIWNTPDCSDRRSSKSKQQGTSNQAKERGGGSGFIPRIATGIKDRVNRLKAIGNGMVPQCMATAWRILSNNP